MYVIQKNHASAPREDTCILMDIQMPVMKGYDATEAIRALKREVTLWGVFRRIKQTGEKKAS